jgi:putative glutamine transport system substrate-binding protein
MILDFSVPYYVAGQAILVRNGSTETTLHDFDGKKMIIVFGSTSERNLRENIPGINVIGYKTYTEAYNALKSGKADGMIADDTILLGYALTDSSVKLLPKRYSQEPYAVVFRKNPQSQQLQNKVSTIIDNAAHSGQLSKMQEQWGIKK